MPTPPKSVKILKLEGKSHRTKQELGVREKEEAKLLTGRPLKESPEVRADKSAHKHFKHAKELFAVIDKDDDLYSGLINRYCLFYSQYEQALVESKKAAQDLEDFRAAKDSIDPDDYYKRLIAMQKIVERADQKYISLHTKLLQIEKEAGLTMMASLKLVDKRIPEKGSALKEALSGIV